MNLAYKYSSELAIIHSKHPKCPPEDISEPNDLQAYRFVFKEENHINNHKPVGLQTPQRILTTANSKKCCLFSLSCFLGKKEAMAFFKEMKRNHKNFEKTVGDSLCEGVLRNDDGHVSPPDDKTHFELFESSTCNLSNSFKVTESLI